MKSSETAYYSSKFGLYHNHCQAMGTRLDLVIHGVEPDTGERVFEQISGSVRKLEKKLSRYDENSPISMVNRLGSRQAVIVDEELFNILTLCNDYYKRTKGLFDISLGKIISEARRENFETSRLTMMLKDAGMDKIKLDPDNLSVQFLNDRIEIDLGGFGKGYALDAVKYLLSSEDISDAFISFGDSSILALGNHPHGTGWKSGISNQFKPGESLFEFDLRNESLSTSGTGPKIIHGYEKGHVLHPVEGLTDQGFQHISVVTDLAVEAEILSTTLLAASEKERSDLLADFPDCKTVEIKYDRDGNVRLRNLNDYK